MHLSRKGINETEASLAQMRQGILTRYGVRAGRRIISGIEREVELSKARIWLAARHGVDVAKRADFFDLAWVAREMYMAEVQLERERYVIRYRPIRTLRDE